MLYLVTDLSTKFFSPNCYLNIVVSGVDKESVIKAMCFEGQPITCAISDPEIVKLVNEDLGSTFEPANVEALLGDEMENSWIIAQVTDGKIHWLSAWTE